MTLYNHIKQEEREKIYLLYQKGESLSKISTTMNRAVSTISREIKRNSSQSLGYIPDRAQQKAEKRRYKLRSKIARHPQLKAYIIEKLSHDKWSPEIIAARIKMANSSVHISHETIYKFIYSLEGQLAKLGSAPKV